MWCPSLRRQSPLSPCQWCSMSAWEDHKGKTRQCTMRTHDMHTCDRSQSRPASAVRPRPRRGPGVREPRDVRDVGAQGDNFASSLRVAGRVQGPAHVRHMVFKVPHPTPVWLILHSSLTRRRVSAVWQSPSPGRRRHHRRPQPAPWSCQNLTLPKTPVPAGL